MNNKEIENITFETVKKQTKKNQPKNYQLILKELRIEQI